MFLLVPADYTVVVCYVFDCSCLQNMLLCCVFRSDDICPYVVEKNC